MRCPPTKRAQRQQRRQRLDGLPPMIGRFEREGTTVRFVPGFPPSPGVTYVARAAWVRDVDGRPSSHSPAATPRPTTKVTAIYPTSDRVPANLLKLYIEFSAPMSDGEAERRVHLARCQRPRSRGGVPARRRRAVGRVAEAADGAVRSGPHQARAALESSKTARRSPADARSAW